MTKAHIHITGASGCGVTTLGGALAAELGITQLDTDDYYWMPPVSEYNEKRPIPGRLQLLEQEFASLDGWVLSGALESWGDPIAHYFDVVIFLQVPTETRLKRLRQREAERYGAENIALGGRHHEETEAFIEWASLYDAGTHKSRTLKRHEDWLATMTCPVLCLDGELPTEDLVEAVMSVLRS